MRCLRCCISCCNTGNLELKSGVLIAVRDGQPAEEDFPWPADVKKDRFRPEIVAASKQAQRTPDATEIFWLSDGVVLIKLGFAEELKIVKKPLECRMIWESNLDAALKKRIKEILWIGILKVTKVIWYLFSTLRNPSTHPAGCFFEILSTCGFISKNIFQVIVLRFPMCYYRYQNITPTVIFKKLIHTRRNFTWH